MEKTTRQKVLSLKVEATTVEMKKELEAGEILEEISTEVSPSV